LKDSHGTPLRLRDFQGRALAFTFIFTRCPLPDFCPRMNAHFAAVQRALAAAAPDAKWSLLCISLDPAYDTPARLAEYATRYGPDAARWTFATGALADIEKIATACGLQVARGGALPEHNLRTVVVDAAGRVQRTFTGNEWTPEELTAEMQRAMSPRR
jgi:protein SCO1/2